MIPDVKYVFIVTAGRSGSRLLANILESSGIYVLYDSDLADNKGLLFESAEVNEMNSSIDERRYNLSFDYSELRRYSKQLDGLKKWAKRIDEELEEIGVREVVIKDPRILYLMPFYQEVFGCPYFVHIIRDGRDFAISKNEECKHYVSETFNPDFLLKLWNHRMQLISCFRSYERFCEIKFEDLIEDPAKSVKTVLTFVGIEKEITVPEILPGRTKRYEKDRIQFSNIDEVEWLRKFGYV